MIVLESDSWFIFDLYSIAIKERCLSDGVTLHQGPPSLRLSSGSLIHMVRDMSLAFPITYLLIWKKIYIWIQKLGRVKVLLSSSCDLINSDTPINGQCVDYWKKDLHNHNQRPWHDFWKGRPKATNYCDFLYLANCAKGVGLAAARFPFFHNRLIGYDLL